MDQLLAHLIGDYVLQSRWMATEKVNHWPPAIVHGLVYTLPFLLLTRSLVALAIIAITHMIIDRYRLARRVMWLRDRLGPQDYWPSWRLYKESYGGKPEYLYFWLMVIVDNTMHLTINYFSLEYFGQAKHKVRRSYD